MAGSEVFLGRQCFGSKIVTITGGRHPGQLSTIVEGGKCHGSRRIHGGAIFEWFRITCITSELIQKYVLRESLDIKLK
jgi:hypothetical protein